MNKNYNDSLGPSSHKLLKPVSPVKEDILLFLVPNHVVGMYVPTCNIFKILLLNRQRMDSLKAYGNQKGPREASLSKSVPVEKPHD